MIILGIILLILLTSKIKKLNSDIQEQCSEDDIKRQLDEMSKRRGLR